MPRYRITTLIDITRTDAKKSDNDQYRLAQQDNFNSLRQSIELRSIVSWHRDPVKHHGRLPDPLDGKASYWIWEFETERDDLFLRDNDPVALLKEDLHGVPIINGLDETVDFEIPAMQTQGQMINTWVVII
jgi:hypothetical protein